MSSDTEQNLATGEKPLSLLCLGDDLLRCLMVDCIGLQELLNLRLCCKVFFVIVDLVEDKNGWLAFDGTTVVRRGSNSTHIDLRQVDPNKATVKRILNSAFIDIMSIELKLPDTVEYIGENAFYFSRLSSLDLSNTLVTHIGYGAFRISRLSTLELPASLKYIGDGAFGGSRLRELELPSSVKYIGRGAFNFSLITSLDLSNTLVTHIGEDAFRSSMLRTLKLPASLKYIGEWAFYSSELTSLDLPAALKYIGEDAFHSSPLTSLDLPASVDYVGRNAFYSVASHKKRKLK